MSIYYEWDVETVNLDETEDLVEGEVVEHNYCANFAEALMVSYAVAPEGFAYTIVLVRDDDNNGRTWAYYEGKLPDQFSDANLETATHVPLRFHREVARVNRLRRAEIGDT